MRQVHARRPHSAPVALGLLCWGGVALAQGAPQSPPGNLADLSLEDLGNIEVTSVSKRPERLAEAPASIYVITAEDIRRAGAVTLPEALRLAPNLEVAEVDASQYAISARGFNINSANKLLVLVDGRSVYTPLHSGVFWDTPDVLLEDIERIEVISGPGGTLWGSNAVNGIINITTRSAADTQGGLLQAGGGHWDRTIAGARWGGRLGDHAAYRVYGTYLNRDHSVTTNDVPVQDAWHKGQGGFRVDWTEAEDSLVLQGDGYEGRLDQPLYADRTIQGQSLLARLGRAWSKDSDLQLQIYYDHTKRDYPKVYGEDRNTVDFDLQHRFKPSQGQEIVWGAGFRTYRDRITNSGVLAFLPAETEHRLANVFAQDSFGFFKNQVTLTLGVKVEHNDYTGNETQPSGRLAWKVTDDQFLWAAISKAVRTPSRIDRDLYFPPKPPYLLAGGPTFRSESLVAYEAGYRVQAAPRMSFSASAYYNDYQHLRSIERMPAGTYVIANQMEGHTYGAELWGEIVLTQDWRLKPGYAYFKEELRMLPGSTDPSGVMGAGNDPQHRIKLRSLLTLGNGWELDLLIRHISALPKPEVPAYTALDVHLGWRPSPAWEVALIGQNLTEARHVEFAASSTAPPSEMERRALVKVTCRF